MVVDGGGFANVVSRVDVRICCGDVILWERRLAANNPLIAAGRASYKLFSD
ncbi:MAG: hypothetical protein V7731_07395 [Amphritea sp.]